MQIKNLKYFLFSIAIIVNCVVFAGAGILPYTKKNDGKFYILLGKEYRGHKYVNKPGNYYSDCGGASDKSDKGNKKVTATREGSEETRCVYGNGSLKKSFQYFYNRLGKPIVKYKGYPLYPVKVRYIRSKVFNNAKAGKHAEKSKYIWIEATDLLKVVKNNSTIPAKYDSKQLHLYPFFTSIMQSKDGLTFLMALSKHNAKVNMPKKKNIKLKKNTKPNKVKKNK